jgi:C1A family cysteine protease
MKWYRLPLLVFTSLAIVVATHQPSGTQTASYIDRFKKDVDAQKASDMRNIEQVRAELRDIQKMIRDRHLQFKADMTEALKRRIEDITGLRSPRNLPEKAKFQNVQGSRSLQSLIDRGSKRSSRRVRNNTYYMTDDESLYYTPPEDEGQIEVNIKIEENRRVLGDNYTFEEEQPRRPEEPSRDTGADDIARDERAGEQARQEEKTPERREPETVELGYLVNPASRAFNMRDKMLLTPIRHQQTCGSCWAFTTVSLLEASYKVQSKKDLDFSEQQIVDCAVGNDGQRAGSCDGGWYGGAFESLQKNGAVLENVQPYRNKNSICPGFRPSSYKVASWGYIMPDASTPSTIEMKKAIARYGAIATCVKVTPAFQSYAGGVFDEHARLSNPTDVNHAVVLVGWDDTKGRQGSFLLRNSWGIQWGENGYMWIEYGCNGIGFGAAWAIAEPVQ